MSAFFDNSITDNGRQLYAEMQAGGTFVPTRIVIGSGYLPTGKTTRTVASVAEPVKSIELNKKEKLNDGDFIIGGVFTNEDITAAFYYRELALYAKVVRADETETAETLYSYGNAGVNAELIPAYSTDTAIERQLDILTYIGNDAVVELEIATGIYVSKNEYDAKIETIEEELDGKSITTPITIPAGRMRGDVDGDGKITQNDVDEITAHYMGTATITDTVSLWCADANADGNINEIDATQTGRYMQGKTSTLTVTPTLADYYNNWTYQKIDDLTGEFYADISIEGMTANHSATVTVKGEFEAGFFTKAECKAGTIRIYAKLCPISALTAIVTWGKGDGTAAITIENVEIPEQEEEVFIATYGTTTAEEIGAAYAAGKATFCKKNNQFAPLASRVNKKYVFTFSYGNQNVMWQCNNDNWITLSIVVPSITTTTATLTVDGWEVDGDELKQTVAVSNLPISGYIYTTYPNSSQYKAWCEAGIYAEDVATADQITFRCSDKPTAEITVNIKKEQVG